MQLRRIHGQMQRCGAVGPDSIDATLPTCTPRIFTLASGFITSPARSEITVTGTVSVKLPRNRPIASAKIARCATNSGQSPSAGVPH